MSFLGGNVVKFTKVFGVVLLMASLAIFFQNCQGFESQLFYDSKDTGTISGKSYPDLRNIMVPPESLSSKGFNLEWSPVVGATEYVFQLSDKIEHVNGSCSGADSLVKLSGLTETKVQIENLRAGFYYFYKVCALKPGEILSSRTLYLQTPFDKSAKYKDAFHSNYVSDTVKSGLASQFFFFTEDDHVVHWGYVSDRIKDLGVISALQSEILFHSRVGFVSEFITKDYKHIKFGSNNSLHEFDSEYRDDLHDPRTKVIGSCKREMFMQLADQLAIVNNGSVNVLGSAPTDIAEASAAEALGGFSVGCLYNLGGRFCC